MTYEDIHIKLRAKGYKYWHLDYFPGNPNFTGFVLYSRYEVDPQSKVTIKNAPLASALVLQCADYLYDIKNKKWLKERTQVNYLGEPTEVERLIYA